MIIRDAIVADAAAIAKVYVDGWHITYPGIIDEEYLTQMSYEKQQRRWFDILSSAHGFIYVAEDETEGIVGFIWGGEEQTGDPLYKGELLAIYVSKAYQRQGLGARLTRTLVERLLREGIHSMLVWVFAANVSRSFYEALGSQQVRTRLDIIGGKAYDDVAYGWQDISVLLAEKGTSR